MGFIATIEADEFIYNFGEGETPEKALGDFISKGAFKNVCIELGIKGGDEVEVSIYKAVFKGDDDWNYNKYHDTDYEFIIEEKVKEVTTKFFNNGG